MSTRRGVGSTRRRRTTVETNVTRAGLAAALLTAALTAPASAATIVDQSTLLPSNGGSSGGAGAGYAGSRNDLLIQLLQTFTVGLDGTFAGVEVQLAAASVRGPNFDLIVEIVTLDATLQPETVLGSDRTTPADVTATSAGRSQLVSFDIGGFEVSAGDMLGLLLRPDGGSRGSYVSPFWVAGVTPNYADGALLSSINGGAFSSSSDDIGFRTLVTTPVPLPASAWLLLAGLGGIGLLRRHA